MKIITKILLVYIVYLAFILLFPVSGQARIWSNDLVPPTLKVHTNWSGQPQLPNDACNGLDVVFLVDRSDSMPLNDAKGNRLEAVRYALNRIGDHALYFCPEAQHRVAVIAFWDTKDNGVDTRVYLEPTIVSPATKLFEEWKMERDELTSKIIYEEPAGGTDFISAFEQAEPILREWRDNPPGSLPRKQAVIVMTDGGPCRKDEGCWTEAEQQQYGVSYSFNRLNYMDRLEELTDPTGIAFPWGADENSNVYIWLIAFNDRNSNSYLNDTNLMNKWNSITKNHGGKVIELKKEQNEDIAPRVAEILDNVLDSDLVKNECGKPIFVPAYLDSLLLNIFKIGSEPEVEIEDVKISVKHRRSDGGFDSFEDGKLVTGEGQLKDYTQDGPNERYLIDKPTPGEWIVSPKGADICRDVDVRFKPVELNFGVTSPRSNELMPQMDEPPYYDPDAPDYFLYHITQKLAADQPVEPVLGYPLKVDLSIQRPDGEAQTCELSRETDGSYRCPDPLLLLVAGSYTWQVEAQTPSVTPSQQFDQVFTDQGTFTVSKVARFNFEILEPTGGTELSLNRVDGGKSTPLPVKVVARLLDETGTPIPPDKIIAHGVEPLFVAAIQGPNGNTIEQDIPLQYDVAQSQFVGEMLTGSSQVGEPGDYQVQVQVKDNYQSTAYRPRLRQQEVTVKRVKVTPVDYKLVALDGSELGAIQPLYQGTMACLGAEVVPVQIAVQFFALDTQQPLNPADLADDPAQLVKVTMFDPSDIETPLTLTAESGQAGDFVVAGGTGETTVVAGDYLVRFTPNPDSLRARYQFVNQTAQEHRLTREDSLLTRPSTCTTVEGGTGGLFLLLLGFMGWNFMSRPTGLITFKDPKTGVSLHEEQLGGGWRTYTSRRTNLKDLGLSKIVVTKAPPTEDSPKAIHLTLYDLENEELLSETLGIGEEVTVNFETVVVYG